MFNKFDAGKVGVTSGAYQPRLDSLRFLAALAVIGYHWSKIVAFGWLGVQIFFVLSGFLITGILIRAKAESVDRGLYFRNFFIRRVLRIFPLYFFYVLLLIIFCLTTGALPMLPQALPWLLTLTLNNARMIPGYANDQAYSHLWSLGVEWQFYLLWPMILLFVPARLLLPFLLAVIVMAPVLRALTYFAFSKADPQHSADVIYNFTGSYFDAFAFGAVVNFEVARRWVQSSICSSLIASTVVVGGLAGIVLNRAHVASLGYTMNDGTPRDWIGQHIWGYSIVSLGAAWIIAVSLGNSVLNRVTSLTSLQYLGKISYGIYVYHAGIIALTFWLFPFVGVHTEGMKLHLIKLFLLVPVVGVTILCAHLSYKYLERPFLRRKERFQDTPRTVQFNGTCNSQ